MRANLVTDGGTIMAEAVMFRLAPAHRAATAAHDLVYDACTVSRERRIDLHDALETTLTPEQIALIAPLEDVLDPATYLGEVDAMVNAALAMWGPEPCAEGDA